jgi:hypothetical protein
VLEDEVFQRDCFQVAEPVVEESKIQLAVLALAQRVLASRDGLEPPLL